MLRGFIAFNAYAKLLLADASASSSPRAHGQDGSDHWYHRSRRFPSRELLLLLGKAYTVHRITHRASTFNTNRINLI